MLMDGIMEIANHNYEKRLDLAKYDEFEGVAKSFNRMAERLTEYRKSTLADIIQGKKYIEAIVNSITEPIIGLDRDRKILFANNEALTILNLKRENVIGKSASELSLRNDLLPSRARKKSRLKFTRIIRKVIFKCNIYRSVCRRMARRRSMWAM